MENKQKRELTKLIISLFIFSSIILFTSLVISLPTGPSDIDIVANETKATTLGQMINISGGIISKVNITASVQNPHWKAFVGWVNGQFTLDDSTGSTIYDWSLSTISGEIYATRASGAIIWSSIRCATAGELETENTALSHTNPDDNITATFGRETNHDAFIVGSRTINADSCPVLYTYVNNVTQSTTFQEVILNDETINVYATIIENSAVGYDGNNYDFQMLVPENGSALWTSATPYYLYVELS